MIRCISPYRASYCQAIVEFKPGDEIEDQAVVSHVLNDSPESFEVVGAPAPAAPAVPTVTTNRATKTTTNKREG
jgi:hypothetical protein